MVLNFFLFMTHPPCCHADRPEVKRADPKGRKRGGMNSRLEERMTSFLIPNHERCRTWPLRHRQRCAYCLMITAGKGCPYQLDGSPQLESTLLILPIDGMEREAADFFIFSLQHCHLTETAKHKVAGKPLSRHAYDAILH